jgi:hypothetical protein
MREMSSGQVSLGLLDRVGESQRAQSAQLQFPKCGNLTFRLEAGSLLAAMLALADTADCVRCRVEQAHVCLS